MENKSLIQKVALSILVGLSAVGLTAILFAFQNETLTLDLMIKGAVGMFVIFFAWQEFAIYLIKKNKRTKLR